jgi:hypothetical protein
MKTFLLRFEERIVQATPVSCGCCRAFTSKGADSYNPLSAAEAGPKKTITEVKREGADADPGSFAFSAFPR